MSTNTEMNRQVLRSIADADNRHDTSEYEQWFDPSVVVHFPDEQVVSGLDAYRALIDGYFRGLPDYYAEADERICEGDTVVHHWRLTGTHDGPLFGMEATGRLVNYRGASVFHLRDGRVVEAWIYPDRATMQRQLSG